MEDNKEFLIKLHSEVLLLRNDLLELRGKVIQKRWQCVGNDDALMATKMRDLNYALECLDVNMSTILNSTKKYFNL